MYDVPPKPSPQTLIFKTMEEAKEVFKKFKPIYQKTLEEIDEKIVELMLELDNMSGKNSLKTMDIITVIMTLDRMLSEVYKEIANGKIYVIRRILEKLGFKLTI